LRDKARLISLGFLDKVQLRRAYCHEVREWAETFSSRSHIRWTPNNGKPVQGNVPMLDILCATLGRLPLGLEHVPGPHRLLTDGRKGWAAASNALLDEACAAGHDALFLDDDVEILPETFSNWARYKPHADVFGWRLKTRAGRAISFGHCLMPNGWLLPNFDSTRPAYVAHVTASVLYIKHAVLAAGLRFPDWPGLHSEDVAFTYDAWLHGFKVAYLPYRRYP
jgi:hypothetical protein